MSLPDGEGERRGDTAIMDGADDSTWVNEIKKMDVSDNGHHDHDPDSSSSSDSEIFYNYAKLHGKNRLFGRQRPIHLVLGGEKYADILLWRNKQISGSLFAGGTFIWLLFQWIGYHLLTFLCHSLILFLTTLFAWSYFSAYINIPPPEFEKVEIPGNLLVTILLVSRREINKACITFREIAAGGNLKKFLQVIMILWAISVVGNWFSFLTLLYLLFALVLTVPALYERNEDMVDAHAELLLAEIKKQFAVVDEKVIRKLPILSSQKSNKLY